MTMARHCTARDDDQRRGARSAQKPCQRDLGGGGATTLSDQHLYLVVQLVPVDNRRDMTVVPRRTRTYCSRTLISTK
jgi:hypothetical protein